jgi:hypothetical protein
MGECPQGISRARGSDKRIRAIPVRGKVTDVYCDLKQKPPQNDIEERERELINALWPHIEHDFAAVHIATALIGHYNTVIYRLRYSLDRLSDRTPLK